MLFLGPVGVPELIIIILIVLLLFGPNRLPELGRSIGKGLREFKRSTSDLMDSINDDPPQQRPRNHQPPNPYQRAQAADNYPPAGNEAPRRQPPQEIVIDLESEDNKDQ